VGVSRLLATTAKESHLDRYYHRIRARILPGLPNAAELDPESEILDCLGSHSRYGLPRDWAIALVWIALVATEPSSHHPVSAAD